jgi:hypothetical protein
MLSGFAHFMLLAKPSGRKRSHSRYCRSPSGVCHPTHFIDRKKSRRSVLSLSVREPRLRSDR